VSPIDDWSSASRLFTTLTLITWSVYAVPGDDAPTANSAGPRIVVATAM